MKHFSLANKLLSPYWLIILLIAGSAFAQPKIITIDTTTGVPSETLPFHHPFFLKKLSARSDKPVFITLFDHIRKKTLTETIVSRTEKYTVVEDSLGNLITVKDYVRYLPKNIPENYFFVRKEGDKNYLYINFHDDMVLQPATQYSVAIYYQAHPDAPEVFRLLHKADSIHATDIGTLKAKSLLIRKAVDEYNKIVEKSRIGDVYFGSGLISYPDSNQLLAANSADFNDSTGIVKVSFPWIKDRKNLTGPLIPFDAGIKTIDSLHRYHHKLIEPLFITERKLQNTLDSAVLVGNRAGLQAVVASLFDTLTRQYLRFDTVSSSKIRDMFTQDNNRIFRSVDQLKQLSNQLYSEVANGLHPLICEFCKNVEPKDWIARVKNLEETMGDVNKVRLLTQLMANQKLILTDLDKRLQQLSTDLLVVRNTLKKQITNQEKLNEKIAENKLFTTTDFVGGDTYVFSFESRTKYSVVPEFGLATNYPFGKSSNYLLMPYIGATINFAQLDRDVPFHLLRKKTFWQRTGLVLGYTLVSLKDSTANPPRDNFFDKSAFITGLSLWRFSNTIKATVGLTWLYKRSPDTGMRSLTALPFIGLSFDLDIKKYLSDLVGAVTSLKGSPDKKISIDSKTP